MTRGPRIPRVPRPWMVAALVRLYPPVWRQEYGAELEEILVARPLDTRVIGDVLWNGLWQRGRHAEPSTIFGLAAMLVIVTAFVGASRTPPSSNIFGILTVSFLTSELYAILLVGCGCWTHLRHGGKVSRSGLAGMRMSLIAAIPVMFGAMLMLFGIVSLTFVGPHTPHPTPLAVLLTPLARLGDSWIWGAVGGLIGKRISHRRERRA
jgi:hypothetical protein